jgi:hypothetical protein
MNCHLVDCSAKSERLPARTLPSAVTAIARKATAQRATSIV